MSLEDSSQFARNKLLAALTGGEKELINNKEVPLEVIDKKMSTLKGRLKIADRARKPDELYDFISAMVIEHNLKFVFYDFYQASEADRGMSDLEKITAVARVLWRINKEFKIPVFSTSQTTKDNVVNVIEKGADLHLGDEKGGGVISDLARYAYYMMPRSPDDATGYDVVKILCDKATYGNQKWRAWNLLFNGASGTIEGCKDTEYGQG
jgi:hypothetical protein